MDESERIFSQAENTCKICPLGVGVKLLKGDCVELMKGISRESVDLVVTSPPYGVGKMYERKGSFIDWKALMLAAFSKMSDLVKSSGIVVIVIADLRCYQDPKISPVRADVIKRQKPPTTQQVIDAIINGEAKTKADLKNHFNVSDQTIERRLKGNNARGEKKETQTRVKLLSAQMEEVADLAGFYLYDTRVWVKDPCWQSCKYHPISYRAVDEFEHVMVFVKRDGALEINRERLKNDEWSKWGSRSVWRIASVRKNDDHPAKFPEELVERIVKLFSPAGGVVLDPFLGSGTTGCVCRRLGRRFIGIEKDDNYFALSKKNILAA
jgi:site-specific DNA-methyltransferase (adenine-specific)